MNDRISVFMEFVCLFNLGFSDINVPILFSYFRHPPANYLVDANSIAAAGKSQRTTPQPASVAGVPVSLGGLTIGRSNSPATRQPPSAVGYTGQHVLPTADRAGQIRYHLPIHATGNAAAGPFPGIRDSASTAYLRANVSDFLYI